MIHIRSAAACAATAAVAAMLSGCGPSESPTAGPAGSAPAANAQPLEATTAPAMRHGPSVVEGQASAAAVDIDGTWRLVGVHTNGEVHHVEEAVGASAKFGTDSVIVKDGVNAWESACRLAGKTLRCGAVLSTTYVADAGNDAAHSAAIDGLWLLQQAPDGVERTGTVHTSDGDLTVTIAGTQLVFTR